MRKFLIAVFIFSSVFVFAKSTNAQTEEKYDYARAYQDYVYTKDQYDKSYSEYRLARSQYLQAQTLVSQSQARDKTAIMLSARDDVIITYLNAIRLKVSEEVGISSTLKTGLLNRLNTEVTWFEGHKAFLSSAGSLDDLVVDSEEAFDHFEETEKLVYESLVEVANGKVSVLRNEFISILSSTRQKTIEINTRGDHDISIVDRWIEEIDETITRSLDKSIESQGNIQTLYSKRGRRSKNLQTYNQSITILQAAQQYLRDGDRFMKEILKAITTTS